jgi:cell division control protein 6
LTVFADKEKLSPQYIPADLPYRMEQISLLHGIFGDFLGKTGRTSEKILRMHGEVGSGKTCTVLSFGREFEKEANALKIPLKFVYTNCKLEAGSRFLLYRKLLEKISPDLLSRGLSPEEMLTQLVNYLHGEGLFVILALDEIDYLVRRMKEQKDIGSVIYDLTRINEIMLNPFGPVVGAIFISRDFTWGNLLDPSEKSTLGDLKLQLSNYKAEQLNAILTKRAEEAFKEGALSEETIAYVADIAANKSLNPGDCRFALDILFYSGLVADTKGSRKIIPEYVRLVAKDSFPGMRTEDLMTLSDRELPVLKATVRALKTRQRPYVSIQECWEDYLLVCEEENISPDSYRALRNHIQDLSLRGFIEYRLDKGVTITGATMEDFDRVILTLERRSKNA